jgi:hypothetical protein
MVTLLVMIVLHVIIAIFLPLRWPAIRSEFARQLEGRLLSVLESTYCRIPTDIAQTMEEEKRQVEKFLGETREVAGWLEQREQGVSIAGLYGKVVS